MRGLARRYGTVAPRGTPSRTASIQSGRGGRTGLQHGNRGHVPANKLGTAVRTQMVRLRRTKYAAPATAAGARATGTERRS
jgi:hypothetical protein